MGSPLDRLDLEIAATGKPGRRAKALVVTKVREVTEADEARLATERGVQPIPIKKLKMRHHGLARLLAAGTGPGEAAAIMQLQPAWVSTLQRDPAFQELVSMYASKVELAYQDTIDDIAGLARDTVVELRDRLEADPESFTHTQLLNVFESMADRSGHGPTSTQVKIETGLADRIEAARSRAKAARLQGEIIDVTLEEPSTEGDTSVGDGKTIDAQGTKFDG